MHYLPRARWGLGWAALPGSPALTQPTLPLTPPACHEPAPGTSRPSGRLGPQLEPMRDHRPGYLDEPYCKAVVVPAIL